MGSRIMEQKAPYPEILERLVENVSYRPGWRFTLLNGPRDIEHKSNEILATGLTLVITTRGYNSYHTDQGETYRVNHYFIVPAATYDERSWRRWLFEQLILVERHEAMEFFCLDNQRPYAPHHGPGNDPYMVFEHGTDIDINTSYLGILKND